LNYLSIIGILTGALLVIFLLNAPNAIASDEKHGKGRDYVQVLCNGLPYAFLAAFAENLPLESLILMSVSIAIATSDTWSSEIGMYFRGTTIDILKLRKQPPGISGGISGVGTLGGFVRYGFRRKC